MSQSPCVFTRPELRVTWVEKGSKAVLCALCALSICFCSWHYPGTRHPGCGPGGVASVLAPFLLVSHGCLQSFLNPSLKYSHLCPLSSYPGHMLGTAPPGLGTAVPASAGPGLGSGGPAFWLLPSKCSVWQVGEKAPLPGLWKGLGRAPSPQSLGEFESGPLPRCARPGQGTGLSCRHLAVVSGSSAPRCPPPADGSASPPCFPGNQRAGAASRLHPSLSCLPPECQVSSGPAMRTAWLAAWLTVFPRAESLRAFPGASC